MSIDINTFLQTSVDQEMATSVSPCPPGEYTATVQSIDLRSAQRKDGSGELHFLDVSWDIQDEAVAKELGRQPRVRQSIILDFNGDALELGEGKNIGLGRLREALGQNVPGKPWSPQMLIGGVATVSVENRVYNDNMYDEVKRVTAA